MYLLIKPGKVKVRDEIKEITEGLSVQRNPGELIEDVHAVWGRTSQAVDPFFLHPQSHFFCLF